MAAAENSCWYCACDDAKLLVRCEACNKAFCNSTIYGRNGKPIRSHAVQHASHLRHVRWSFPSLTDATLFSPICSEASCGQESVFELGVVKKDKYQRYAPLPGQLPHIICRKHAEKKHVDTNGFWEPLVFLDKGYCPRFQDWLCPTHNNPGRLFGISSEEDWAIDDCRLAEEYDLLEETRDFRQWLLEAKELKDITTFTNVQNYRQHFIGQVSTIMKLEKAFIDALESLTVLDSEIRKAKHIRVTVPSGLFRDMITSFSPVVLYHVDTDTAYEGAVSSHHETEHGTNLWIELKKGLPYDGGELDGEWEVDLGFKEVMYRRMETALNRMSQCTDPVVMKLILDPQDLSRQNVFLPQLGSMVRAAGNHPNDEQQHAVRFALSRHLSLIRGPPGTGKTATAALIVLNFLWNNRDKRVLCCAGSNNATDQLCIAIRDVLRGTNFSVIRLLPPSLSAAAVAPAIRDLVVVSNRDSETKDSIFGSSVVCATCNSAGVKKLGVYNKHFSLLILDECNQSLETDCLIPITKSIPQVVLVGDQKQLGPVVRHRCLENSGLKQSLFARLWNLDKLHGGKLGVTLKKQYRMHSYIAQMVSDEAYGSDLQTMITDDSRRLPVLESMMSGGKVAPIPLVFVDVRHEYQVAGSGNTYINTKESHVIARLVANALLAPNNPLRPEQIGIITFYNGQKHYIQAELKKHKGLAKNNVYQRIEVNSVDGFQGREKDLIILSCVRSGGSKSNPLRPGFVDDPQRLNVAMSRAKSWIIAVGDRRVFADKNMCRNWSGYLEKFRTIQWDRDDGGVEPNAPDAKIQLPVACVDSGCPFGCHMDPKTIMVDQLTEKLQKKLVVK